MARTTEASRNRRQPATERDLTHAAQFTRPPTRVRPTQPRPLYPATNQAARAMRNADYARKQVACALVRPTEHPSAPAIRVQKDQASDSTSNAATSDTPRKRDEATQPDRPHLRAIDQPQLPLRPPARECGQIPRTLPFIKNDSASSIKA